MRLPDVVIIGAMKSGTTSLFRWLDQQPEIEMSKLKEPHFFSDDRVWRRGLEWYSDCFSHVSADRITGEASTTYALADRASVAAERMASLVPDVRLVYLVRHPIERLRSHYRHQVQRGRERRTLAQALRSQPDQYVGTSRYWTCLAPYVERFPREQICVVRLEDLLSPAGDGWSMLTSHLGLGDRPRPEETHNVTAEKAGFTGVGRRLWDWGILEAAGGLPRPVRRLGRKLVLGSRLSFEERLRRSEAPIPGWVAELVWEDVARLESWLGRGRLWARED